jgi:hypothetical protein
MGQKHQRLTASQWRRLFQRQRSSGLSVAAFCQREGVAVSTFFAKRRQLEWSTSSEPRRSEGSASGARERSAAPAFVEVRSTGPAEDEGTDPGDENAAGAGREALACSEPEPIELVLDRGVVVRVRAGFDASLLRRVVEALG